MYLEWLCGCYCPVSPPHPHRKVQLSNPTRADWSCRMYGSCLGHALVMTLVLSAVMYVKVPLYDFYITLRVLCQR